MIDKKHQYAVKDIFKSICREDKYCKDSISLIVYKAVKYVHKNYDKIEEEKIHGFMIKHLNKCKDTNKYYFNYNKKTKNQLPINIFDSTEINISTDELLTESADVSDDIVSYEYPLEKSYEKLKYGGFKYEPYGTQSVHEIQTNDVITNKEIILTEKYNKVRKIKSHPQGTLGWHTDRNSGITASSVASALNIGAFTKQYQLICDKVNIVTSFESNKYCHHGTMLEEPATMIYAYRKNVQIAEFGLIKHQKYNFIGASPDGICNQYKYDGKHLSNKIGRMLEIKCPLSRVIKMDGEIKGEICPIYYWMQVQIQLECCDLEECDFWQCKITTYSDRNEFIQDTHHKYPYLSAEYTMEKGCLIQLLPIVPKYDNHWRNVYNTSKFIYPTKIEMTPYDCDKWVIEELEKHNKNLARAAIAKQNNDTQFEYKYEGYRFHKVVYWRLEQSKCVTITRDKQWFAETLPKLREVWNIIEFFRKNTTEKDLIMRYINSKTRKNNDDIMSKFKMLMGKYNKNKFISEIEKNEINKKNKSIKPKLFTNPRSEEDIDLTTPLFVNSDESDDNSDEEVAKPNIFTNPRSDKKKKPKIFGNLRKKPKTEKDINSTILFIDSDDE